MKGYFKQLLYIFLFFSFKPLCGQTDSLELSIPIRGDVSLVTYRFSYWNKQKQELNTQWNVAGVLNTSVKLWGHTSLNLSFFKHGNRQVNNLDYIYDYSYSMIRSNWLPNSFSFGYNNYGRNKYSNSAKEIAREFLAGFYFVEYSLPEFTKITKPFIIDSTTSFSLNLSCQYALKYYNHMNDLSQNLLHGKPILSLRLKYTIVKSLFVQGELLHYLNKESRLPWDPDFTYSFGLDNYKKNSLRFSYINALENYYPWRNKTSNATFFHGFFIFSFNYCFY